MADPKQAPAAAPAVKKKPTGYRKASDIVNVFELFSDENVARRLMSGEPPEKISADYAKFMAPAMQKAKAKDAREITKYDITQTAAEEAKAIYNPADQAKMLGRPLTAEETALIDKQFNEEFNRRAARGLQAASAFAKSAWGKDLEDGGPIDVPEVSGEDLAPQSDAPAPVTPTKTRSVAGFGDAKAADRAYDVPAEDDKAKKAAEAKAKIKKGIEAWAGSRKDTEVK